MEVNPLLAIFICIPSDCDICNLQSEIACCIASVLVAREATKYQEVRISVESAVISYLLVIVCVLPLESYDVLFYCTPQV